MQLVPKKFRKCLIHGYWSLCADKSGLRAGNVDTLQKEH